MPRSNSITFRSHFFTAWSLQKSKGIFPFISTFGQILLKILCSQCKKMIHLTNLFEKRYHCGWKRKSAETGGQKPGMAVDWALVGSPKILLLDDTASALDRESKMPGHIGLGKVHALSLIQPCPLFWTHAFNSNSGRRHKWQLPFSTLHL